VVVALPDPSNRTVLIVEDAESCATTLEIALLAIPHIQVRVASTAGQALELLMSAGGAICALVTDLNLPSMDGFELIERVRSNSQTARLPIVVVSGDTDPRTPERIHRLGANAYFGKPYSPAQVRQKVEQLLDANSPSHSP
jgi:CheY-like chemotaxis protein